MLYEKINDKKWIEWGFAYINSSMVYKLIQINVKNKKILPNKLFLGFSENLHMIILILKYKHVIMR